MLEPKLLTDEQVLEFICNGFLRLRPNVELAVHQDIEARLRWSAEHEFAMGNNILPRVPQMYDVLESPEVAGALRSLLGHNYLLHPHRAVHTSTPVDDPDLDIAIDADAPRMGKGSMAGSGWHQDAQSPLSRARHHVPRYLIVFYFPHDTPRKMGPTRLQAGSHLYAHPVEPKNVVLPDHVEAGTVFIMHFDIVHAAFPNRLNDVRHMVKFVFARTEEPGAPTWSASDREFRIPHLALADHSFEPAWRYIWYWMCGDRTSWRDSPYPPNSPDSPDSPELSEIEIDHRPMIAALNSTNQHDRLRAVYTLAGQGDSVIAPLVEKLLESAGQDRSERLKAVNENGNSIPRDARHSERRWTERAVVMDDAAYALGAVGAPAIPALMDLLGHADDWIKINACFALGECGRRGKTAVWKIAELLTHGSQHVVRQALDALGAMGAGIEPALPHIRRLLATRNDDWQQPEVTRGWSGQDQVRLNAVLALLNAINDTQADLELIEDILVGALEDENGYVGSVAAHALTRIATATAQKAALHFYSRRQWDPSLQGGVRTY